MQNLRLLIQVKTIILGAILAGGLIGYILDNLLQTAPVLLALFIILGGIVAIFAIGRLGRKWQEQQKTQSENRLITPKK